MGGVPCPQGFLGGSGWFLPIPAGGSESQQSRVSGSAGSRDGQEGGIPALETQGCAEAGDDGGIFQLGPFPQP